MSKAFSIICNPGVLWLKRDYVKLGVAEIVFRVVVKGILKGKLFRRATMGYISMWFELYTNDIDL